MDQALGKSVVDRGRRVDDRRRLASRRTTSAAARESADDVRAAAIGGTWPPGTGRRPARRRSRSCSTGRPRCSTRKRWQEWIDLFDDDGVYWMPVDAEQTDWLAEPSIFAEDKLMMEIRMGRLSHPNAWSQAPMWGTNHLVGNVVIESVARRPGRQRPAAIAGIAEAGLGSHRSSTRASR